jgi:uncharacterized repeat protein (TIGR01451 family)
VNAGKVDNTATAMSNETEPANGSATVPAVQHPQLTLAKVADPTTYNAVGAVIAYSYKVTNSGNVTLTGPITVTDNKATVTCPATATLAPAASITCTASYTITQADLDAGSVTNIATAHASFGEGKVDSNQATATVTANQTAKLTLVKKADLEKFDAVGQVITYSYLVTNSGNVKLAGPVTVADDKATVTCPAVTTVGNLDGFLDPGESITCTAKYTVTQADLDAGLVTNIATASVSYDDGTLKSNPATVTVPGQGTQAATATPKVTPPPTDTLPVNGTPGGDSWRLVLLALAGILASMLLLTPATPKAIRRRR